MSREIDPKGLEKMLDGIFKELHHHQCILSALGAFIEEHHGKDAFNNLCSKAMRTADNLPHGATTAPDKARIQAILVRART